MPKELFKVAWLKEIVHPKLKLHQFPTHPDILIHVTVLFTDRIPSNGRLKVNVKNNTRKTCLHVIHMFSKAGSNLTKNGNVTVFLCNPTVSLPATLEWLRRLENVTGACVDKVVSSRWVKFELWVKYPFKAYSRVAQRAKYMKDDT